MIPAYLTAMRNYASFDGRTSPGGFWWFKLALALLCLAGLGLDGIFFGGPDDEGVPIFCLVLLAHSLPSLALDVRRLHDTDRSGWFVLLGLVPLVGPVLLLVWFCQRGAPGPNRFGPDPFDAAATPSRGATLVGAPARSTHTLVTAMRDVVSEVERLAKLRASGTLSEAEFAMLKAQVMTGSGQA